MRQNRILSIFDFDKTLVRRDSFRLFSLLVSGTIWSKALVLLLALGSKAKLLSNQKYKEWVLKIAWLKKDEKEKDRLLQKLFFELRGLENPEIVHALKTHIERGDRVVVLSASPSFYLKPYVQFWSEDIKVFGSELQVVSGKIKFDNLYGLRKELCTRLIIEQEMPSEVWIYTDHISDLPIMKLADHVRLVKPSSKLCETLHKLKIEYEIIELGI